MTKARASRGRPSLARAAEIGNLVVDAAILAFVEQGLDISIEQIAQSVGVSKQAIYRRWPSKIHLLMDVMGQVMDKVYCQLSDDLPEDPRAALKELSWRMCRPDGGVRERSLTILMSEALHDRSLHIWLESWRENNFDFYLPYVAAVRAADDSRDSIALTARLLRDIVEGVSRDCYWSKLSDPECESLFLQKWDAVSKLL
ncbi:TetR/AcrR family transcriptional regulator [Sphingomonas sanguinis]|uniref:TetR/AcrR family transcriptional regulator n=1 Tax=Sphingomonas sanguinis TaxID=33051 RepID=A0ABU5LMG8_9SPHN|nr:TetR/AcrR family transcriptional regulator [Sphingomonas sanguinis]MDZ7281134.1 TetR/AcrR family transcriptional regulator [Sphingomonas sanguinis]QXT34177.1 TetR/AcrR family transcriptional regulator [Sphingomonas sanguinis]